MEEAAAVQLVVTTLLGITVGLLSWGLSTLWGEQRRMIDRVASLEGAVASDRVRAEEHVKADLVAHAALREEQHDRRRP